MRLIIIFVLIIAGCSSSKESSDPSISGVWKSLCYTNESIDYWVTFEYTFTDNQFSQLRHFHDNSDCVGGMDGEIITSTREGFFSFVNKIETSSGLSADLYDFHYYKNSTKDIDYSLKTGVFIDNDVLYLVHPEDDVYFIDYDLPLYEIVK